MELFRRPFVGPLIFGLSFGGIPIGLVFSRLGGAVVSPEVLRLMIDLSPVAALVTIIGALLGGDNGWKNLLRRVFLTSLACCVPVPTIVCGRLMWHWGYEVLGANNLHVFVLIFIGWATALTAPCWLLALGYTFLKNRDTHAGGVR